MMFPVFLRRAVTLLLVAGAGIAASGGSPITFQWRLPESGTWKEQVLSFSSANDSPTSDVRATTSVKLDGLGGKHMILKAEVKGTALSVPPKRWLGIRFVLSYRSGGELRHETLVLPLHGTFDWKAAELLIKFENPAPHATLSVCLSGVTGKLEVRKLRLEPSDGREKIKPFAQCIDLGFLVLSKFNPEWRACRRPAELIWGPLRQKLSAMPVNEAWDALRDQEELLFSLSALWLPNQMSPNLTAPGQTLAQRQKKLKTLENARFADWETAAVGLRRQGLRADVSAEIERLRNYSETSPARETLPAGLAYDRAFVFYKAVAEERLRLGGRLLTFERELAAWKKMDPKFDAGKLSWYLADWRNAYNAGDFPRCARREEAAERLRASLVERQFKSKNFHPGTGLYSVGTFGFGGTWHSLLPFSVRRNAIFLDGRNFFQCYQGTSNDWEVSFDVTDALYRGYRVKELSWTHTERIHTFEKLDTHEKYDVTVWWSILAPGVLYDFPAKSVTISDNTRQIPEAPARIAAEIDGEVQILTPETKISASRLSANWLLLLWENSAPKFPVVITFARTPEVIRFDRHGLVLEHAKGIGKLAAGTLYGAVAQNADYGKDWKELPAAELARVRSLAGKLNYFPLALEEEFRQEGERIRLRNRITRAISLNSNARPYIPVPPLYALAQLSGLDVQFDRALSEPLFLTAVGHYRTAPGTSLEYTLPIPDLAERIVLRPSGEEKMIREYNERIMLNGEFRQIPWIAATSAPELATGALSGLALLTPESRRCLESSLAPGDTGRLAAFNRFLGASEHSGVEYMIPDFQIEPVSGKCAWLCGWRGARHGEPIKGDMTWYNTRLIAFNYSQALIFGRRQLVERNWERLREIYSAADFNQTWHVPGMNTTSSGLILGGDMLGDGYRIFPLMHKMAKIVKDREMEARTLYLATKQAMTICAFVHPNILPYSRALHNVGKSAEKNAAINMLGIDSYGIRSAPWEPKNPSAWNAPFQSMGCGNYDYPFLALLLSAAPEATRAWIDRFQRDIPEWSNPVYWYRGRTGAAERHRNAWNVLKFLALTTTDRQAVRERYYRDFPPDFLQKKAPAHFPAKLWEHSWYRYLPVDWSMRINAAPYIIAQNDPIWIADFGASCLVSGRYDRQRREGVIELVSESPETLTFASVVKPLSLTVNGTTRKIPEACRGIYYKLALPAGNSTVRITVPTGKESELLYPKFHPGRDTVNLNFPIAPEPGRLTTVRMPETIKVGNCRTLDLAPFCNRARNDAAAEVWNFPREDMVRGIPFRFASAQKGVIMLKGKQFPGFPVEVKGIPVGTIPHRVFFYHGVCYGKPGVALTYRLNFADGQSRLIPVYCGSGIGEWKLPPGKKKFPDLPEAMGATPYAAARPGQWGEGVGGYIFSWTNDVVASGVTMQGVNQQGMARLESIDVISTGTSTPLILAITVEE